LAGKVGGVHGVCQGRVDRRELREALLPTQPEQFNNLRKVGGLVCKAHFVLNHSTLGSKALLPAQPEQFNNLFKEPK